MSTDDEVMEMAAVMNETSDKEAIDVEMIESKIRRFAERMENITQRRWAA